MHLHELDQFADGSSWLHTWDPRVKLISLSALVIVLVLLPSLAAALAGFACALFLLRLSGIPLGFVAVHLRRAFLFLGLMAAVLCITVPGTPLLQWWVWTISREGLRLGALILVRGMNAVVVVLVMIGTQRFETALHSLQSLHVPSPIVQLLMFSYRYLFLFLGETDRLFTAARSRGWHFRARISSLATFGNLLGMLLVRSFERTERIRVAMLSRGYQGRVMVLQRFQAGRLDFIKALIIGGLAASLLLLGWIT